MLENLPKPHKLKLVVRRFGDGHISTTAFEWKFEKHVDGNCLECDWNVDGVWRQIFLNAIWSDATSWRVWGCFPLILLQWIISLFFFSQIAHRTEINCKDHYYFSQWADMCMYFVTKTFPSLGPWGSSRTSCNIPVRCTVWSVNQPYKACPTHKMAIWTNQRGQKNKPSNFDEKFIIQRMTISR